MTPRPLHKWKTLWLGILILAFLSLAWSRSRNYADYIAIPVTSRTAYGIMSSRGYIHLATATFRAGIAPTSNNTEVRSDRGSWNEPWFPRPFSNHRSDDRGIILSYHGIAYWLLALLFLITWLSFFLWRTRRMRSLTIPPPLPTPSHDPAPPP